MKIFFKKKLYIYLFLCILLCFITYNIFFNKKTNELSLDDYNKDFLSFDVDVNVSYDKEIFNSIFSKYKEKSKIYKNEIEIDNFRKNFSIDSLVVSDLSSSSIFDTEDPTQAYVIKVGSFANLEEIYDIVYYLKNNDYLVFSSLVNFESSKEVLIFVGPYFNHQSLMDVKNKIDFFLNTKTSIVKFKSSFIIGTDHELF